MPYHLIRNVDFDARLWNSFSAPKRAAIANIKPADSGKLQLEFASRYYDVSRVVSGQLVHLSAVSYSDAGTAKAPGCISTWEGNPRSPSGLGIIVNYTGGHAGETLRDATAIPGAQAPLEREGFIHFAGEACDVEYWSYMNGAIRSGERVAQQTAQG
jgi:hypothetical protein